MTTVYLQDSRFEFEYKYIVSADGVIPHKGDFVCVGAYHARVDCVTIEYQILTGDTEVRVLCERR